MKISRENGQVIRFIWEQCNWLVEKTKFILALAVYLLVLKLKQMQVYKCGMTNLNRVNYMSLQDSLQHNMILLWVGMNKHKLQYPQEIQFLTTPDYFKLKILQLQNQNLNLHKR